MALAIPCRSNGRRRNRVLLFLKPVCGDSIFSFIDLTGDSDDGISVMPSISPACVSVDIGLAKFCSSCCCKVKS